MSSRYFHRTGSTTISAGEHLRRLRQQAGLSQLDLSLIAGISQRHLSCVETGRAKVGPSTLHAILSALDVPLERCNEVFLAAGFAPRYVASSLDAQPMEMVHGAINHILHAHNPAPAIVLASNWDIIAANASASVLFGILGLPEGSESSFNLLATLLAPGGLGDHLINAAEVRMVAWQRASREANANADLAYRLQGLPCPSGQSVDIDSSPVVLTRVRSAQGELKFLSTFTTFGMPLDITVESLRIEHLIPADAHTWQTMTKAYEQSMSAQA